MTKDGLRYDRMVEAALRGVVREAIAQAAENGLPGGHHFYITFKTNASGVDISDHLRTKYPEEMTIVIEHQFWDLTVTDDSFAVTLSFNNRPERLTVPFTAIGAFADPSVKFGLQFQETMLSETPVAGAEHRLRLAETPVATDAPKGGKEKSSPKLVEEKSAGESPGESRGDKKPAAGKATAKKPGEVVTLDTFRKK
jgi:uncharacterized protein